MIDTEAPESTSAICFIPEIVIDNRALPSEIEDLIISIFLGLSFFHYFIIDKSFKVSILFRFNVIVPLSSRLLVLSLSDGVS